MSGPRLSRRFPSAVEAEFRNWRITGLAEVNANTFWTIVIIILAFGIWDAYADPEHWPAAFRIRIVGAAIIVATGLFQNLPGKAQLLPLMAKIALFSSAMVEVSSMMFVPNLLSANAERNWPPSPSTTSAPRPA